MAIKPPPDCDIYQEVINCPLTGPIHVVQRGAYPCRGFWSPWIAIRKRRRPDCFRRKSTTTPWRSCRWVPSAAPMGGMPLLRS